MDNRYCVGMATAVYMRISEDRLGLELGVDRQREDCLELAERRGWTQVREFADNDISATKGKRRPDYQALMTAIDAGEVQRVIVWHTSRIWRNRKERADGIERMRAAKVSLIPVKGAELDMGTASGRMLAGLLGEFDTGESEIKQERSLREQVQRAQRGLFSGGPRAYGYAPDGMALVEAEAAQVRGWYTALLAGGSISPMARTAGKNHSSVLAILKNPRNAGLRILHGVEHPGQWPAIVPVETWRAARDLLTDPGRRSNRNTARRWIGAGLYRCERCHGRVVESAQNGGGTKGDLWQVYRCLRARGGCGRSWKQDRLDRFIVSVVEARLARDDLGDLLPGRGKDVAKLRTEAAALRLRLPRLSEMWALGELTDDQFQSANRAAQGRLAVVVGGLAEATKASALSGVLGAGDPVAAWRAIPDDDVPRKQAVIRGLMTVTLGASPPGRTPFDPEGWVHIEWRQE